jgi:putative ABC transport system permease protein
MLAHCEPWREHWATTPRRAASPARELEVAGITNDYLVGGLSLYMHRETGKALLGITGCDGYVVFAEPGKQRELRDTLQKLCNKHGVLLHTVGQIREIVEEKVRGLNVMLWALVILMFVVAAFGVVNTLTMNVLEQTRELAILRIVAMTRAQTRRTILCQAVIIATVGVLPGVAAGVMVAYLINVLAGPSIGHPVDFGSHPYLLTLALIGGFGLTVGAALLPARRASNVNVAQALHYE